MKESLEKAIEGGAFKAAGVTGVAASVNSAFDWINYYASALGVIIALISVIAGSYFNHKRHDNGKIKDENNDLKSENLYLREELSKLSRRERDQ